MVVLASGTNVSVAMCREAVIGTTPTGLSTPVDNVEAQAGGTGDGKFVRASGSWVTDGFAVGQWVTSSGFATSNGNWYVTAVTATDLTVEDENDTIVPEVAAAGQKVEIRLKTLRTTGRAINPERNILESAEVRSTRQKSDVRHGFERVTGTPGFELSAKSYDDVIAGVMASSWYAVVVTGSPTITVNGTNKYFIRSTGSWVTDGFRAGDIITTSGFGDAGNNGTWRVTAVSATNLTVADPDSSMVTDATGGGTVTFPGKRIDVGTSLFTFFVERQFSDITQYEGSNGVAFDQLQLQIQPEQIAGGTLNMLGMKPLAMAGSSAANSAALAAPTNAPFAAFDGEIYEGGTVIAVATGLNVTLANNRSLNPVIGSKNSPTVFEGTFEVNGEATLYFQAAVMINKFVNETESSLWVKLDDTNGTDFVNVVVPRIKYTGRNMDPPQQGPVPLPMPFRGLEQSGLAYPGGTTVASSISFQRSNTYAA